MTGVTPHPPHPPASSRGPFPHALALALVCGRGALGIVPLGCTALYCAQGPQLTVDAEAKALQEYVRSKPPVSTENLQRLDRMISPPPPPAPAPRTASPKPKPNPVLLPLGLGPHR